MPEPAAQNPAGSFFQRKQEHHMNYSFKKKIGTVGAALLVLGTASFAQQTIDAKTTANFEMRAHTSAGYDFETNRSGLETQIDQVQVWFEIFPYDTYGVTPQAKKGLNVSIRAEGLKYAFKWFDMYRKPTDDTAESVSSAGRYSESRMDTFECERIVAEVGYRDFYLSIADTDNPVWFSSASLQSIFDELAKKSGDENLLGIPFTGITKDSVKSAAANFDISGILSTGYRTDLLSAAVKAASKGTWLDNERNAWIFGGSITAKPLKDLSASADFLTTVNYTFKESTREYVDVTQFGLKSDYAFHLTDEYVIKPYAGFDGMYKQNEFSWEAGAGFTFYWRGAEYAVPYDILNIWNLKIPVGFSAAFNVNDANQVNLICSLFEDSAPGGLIPNLGGFAEFELRNAASSDGKDARAGIAVQIEYRVTKKIRPYLFAKYVQGYGSGKLTGTDDLNTRAGVLFVPAPRFSVDLRYERSDKTGKNPVYDDGAITARFAIKL